MTEPRPAGGDTLRRAWGLQPEHRVVGITARIQPHRRFDLLWETAAHVCRALPAARFVLLGRGNAHDTEQLVAAPIRALSLQDRVVLPGYLKEPHYGAALRSLDAFLFLVPGSDGTCRAVREAMASGLPVVCTERGMLPEIVAPAGRPASGVALPESAAALGSALVALLQDDARRRALGAAARQRTQCDMDPARAAAALAAFCERLLSEREPR